MRAIKSMSIYEGKKLKFIVDIKFLKSRFMKSCVSYAMNKLSKYWYTLIKFEYESLAFLFFFWSKRSKINYKFHTFYILLKKNNIWLEIPLNQNLSFFFGSRWWLSDGLTLNLGNGPSLKRCDGWWAITQFWIDFSIKH